MSINLVESIQTNLNYPRLQKIDPNTQEVVVDNTTPNEHRLSQASIPAMLTGLFRYSTLDDAAENLLRGDISSDWVNIVFGDTASEVIQKIAAYSFNSTGDVHQRLNDIAREAVKLARENIKPAGTMMDLKQFFSSQTKTILLYLPEALHMGALLKDNTLDDNTNKMEGPISSLMHKIGSAFSTPANEAELKTK